MFSLERGSNAYVLKLKPVMIYTHTHTHCRAGSVLTFYTNQQTFNSLDSIQDSVDRATDYGVEFAEDLINVCAEFYTYTYIHE